MADREQEGTENPTSSTDHLANALNESTITESRESSAENPASTESPEDGQNTNEDAEELTNDNNQENANQIDEAAVAEHERKIRLYQNNLDVSTDEEYRPTGMIELASSMADLCSARENAPAYKAENLAMLHKASEKARDAIEMVDEEYRNWAYVIASSANIFNTLYDACKDPKYLDETIDASEKAVECYVNKEFFARRSYRLAAQLQERWIVRKDSEDHADLKAAIHHAKISTDNSYVFNEVGKWRLNLYSQLVIENAVITGDVKSLEALIDFHIGLRDGTIAQDEPDQLDPDEKAVAENLNIIQLEMAYCWHWGMTKKAEDLDLLADCVARNLVKENPNRALMICEAVRVFQIREINRHDTRYKVPVMALELVVLLHQMIWEALPKTKNSHLADLQSTAVDGRYAAFEMFERTDLAKWGWIYDDFNTLESRVNVLMMTTQDHGPDEDIVFGRMSSVGESIVLKKLVCKPVMFDPWEVAGFWLEDVKPENYVRKRNEDGTVELGMTEADGDVWKWYKENYERKDEQKEEPRVVEVED